jgi:hypothetical protein
MNLLPSLEPLRKVVHIFLSIQLTKVWVLNIFGLVAMHYTSWAGNSIVHRNLSWFWGMNFFFTWAGLLMVQIGLLLHVIEYFEIFSQLEVSYWFLGVIQVIGLQESWRFRALAGGRDKNFTVWSGGKSQCDHIEALEFSLLSLAKLTQHPVFVRCSLLQAADVLPAEKERTFHQKIV